MRAKDAWLLGWLALLVLGAGLGLREPWPADEPRFALAAVQMALEGDWLYPHRGLELYADKPPLFMWLQAASWELTRSWRIAFLLPSLLASLGTLWLVYDLSRRVWSKRAAWWATFALLFTLHFAYQAKKAQIDPTVVFFIALGCYGLLRHVLKGPAWGWYALGGFAAGLGVITKGVGFLALLILLPYAWARWRGARGLAPIERGGARWAYAPLAFLAAIALWAVPMALVSYGSGDPALIAYADEILFKQTAQRYAQAWHHVKPFWYFAGVIVPLWLPLNLAWPWAIPAWWRRIRVRRDARVFIPLAWVVLVLLFFSATPGKRDMYVLPALPMLAFATAPLLPGLLRRRGFQWLVFGAGALLATLLLVAGSWALLGEPRFETAQESLRGLDAASDRAWWMLATCGALGLAALAALRPRRGLLAFGAATFPVWLLVFGLWGYPLLDAANSGSALMRRVDTMVEPDAELGLVAWKEQLLLQAGRPVAEWGFRRPWHEQRHDARNWLREAPWQRWALVREEALGNCIERTAARRVGRSNRLTWYLVGYGSWRIDCRETPGETDADPATTATDDTERP